MSECLFKTTILGRVVSKKNSKRIIRRAGRSMVISSAQYLGWAQDAALKLQGAALTNLSTALLGPLELHIKFYFENRQHEMDLDNCLGGPLDVLQQAGIIENDKQILIIKAEKIFGQKPRVEIELYKIKGE